MQTKAFNVVNMLFKNAISAFMPFSDIPFCLYPSWNEKKKKKISLHQQYQMRVQSHLHWYPDAEGREHPLGGEKQDWNYSKSKAKIWKILTSTL